GKGDKEAQQLSNDWMKQQMERMKEIHPDTYAILKANRDKIHFKANVLDAKGTNRWYDYGKFTPVDKNNKAVRTVINRGVKND
ncbi:MAG: hypothetical protein ACK5XN_38560, partial [Bacteroidota bacterium]